MEYLVGVLVAVGVAGLATVTGLDRGRSFYPTVLIVVASYYVLFAAMGGSTRALEVESAVGAGFLALALLGFRSNMWLVAAGIAGHGLFDIVHHLLIANPGVPVWWPGFCATVDLILGGWLAVRLWKAREQPQFE